MGREVQGDAVPLSRGFPRGLQVPLVGGVKASSKKRVAEHIVRGGALLL